MKNLGKIAIGVLFLLQSVNASVVADISPSVLVKGEVTTYTLKINGTNVKKPVITQLCGHDVLQTSSQTSIQSINGSYTKSYTLSYSFMPLQDCEVPPMRVSVNSKDELSNATSVVVKKQTQNLSGDFVLSLKTDAKELYVGEPFELTLLLKQKNGVNAIDSKFTSPDFKGFWLKSQGKEERTQKAGYSVTKLVYRLAPQREGTLHIDAAKLDIAYLSKSNPFGAFGSQAVWKPYFSNTLDFDVKALPQNVNIIGVFSIKAKADKQVMNPNEAVNVMISIDGKGNLEDIESFKTYVKDVNVFDEDIVLSPNHLSQKLVFVGDSDFTIPSFTLKYFDIKTKSVKTVQTQSMDVKVNGTKKEQKLEITRDKGAVVPVQNSAVNSSQASYLLILMSFVIGLVTGAFIVWFVWIKKSVESKKSPKLDVKNQKLLLVKLLPYKESDSDVAGLIAILEENLYSNSNGQIDKKLLKELLKRHNIS